MISGQLYNVLAASTLGNPDHGCNGSSKFPEVDGLNIFARGFDGPFLGHVSHSEFFALVEQEHAGEGHLHQTVSFAIQKRCLLLLSVSRETERGFSWILSVLSFVLDHYLLPFANDSGEIFSSPIATGEAW